MQQSGSVSVWVGSFDDEEQFFEYVEKDYSDDEATSAFISQAGVEEYDEDFAEGIFFDPQELGQLDDISYFSTFRERVLTDLRGRPENAAYFIYDVATEPGAEQARLQLLGTYPYQQV